MESFVLLPVIVVVVVFVAVAVWDVVASGVVFGDFNAAMVFIVSFCLSLSLLVYLPYVQYMECKLYEYSYALASCYFLEPSSVIVVW